MALISAIHIFSYDKSTDPWGALYDPGQYSAEDNHRISNAVLRVCGAQDRSVLVPVLIGNGLYHYVKVTRADEKVNIMQFRIDFSLDGKYAILERPILTPDSIRAVFPHMVFKSERLSTPDMTSLFWDVLRTESLAQCRKLVTQTPLHTIFVPSVLYYKGNDCFTAATYNEANFRRFDDHRFENILSAALLEAISHPGRKYSQLIPFDGDAVQRNIDRRRYVGVLREAHSLDIKLVFFNGNMTQCKVVFYTFNGATRTYVTTIPQLPGFNLISNRLTETDKDALMQTPVRAHWNRPGNRIEPVGGSLHLFASPAYVFEYNRAAVTAMPDRVQFNPLACRRIQEGVALVCCSGGPNGVLVPIQAELPPIGGGGGVVSFLLICHDDVRHVNTVYIELINAPRMSVVYETILPQDFKSTLPHMAFSSGTVIPDEWNQSFVLDTLHSTWTERIDRIVVTVHPHIVTTGVKFDYRVTWPSRGAKRVKEGGRVYGTKPLRPIAAARTERVIRAMSVDTGIGSLLVPVPENGPNAYVAAVREGANINIGFISRIDRARFIEPLRSSETVVPNLTYIPLDSFMDITPDINRTLFEEPIFSYWHNVAVNNPHNWVPRAAAIGLAMHPRVGANSPMRVLDDELIALVVKFCLQ